MSRPDVEAPRAPAPGAGLARTLLTRVLGAVGVLVAAATVAFLLVRLSGDPVALLLPPDATAEQEASLRASLGLDRPLVVQYLDYLWGLPQLDFGTSLFYDRPVADVLLERIPATLQLAAAAAVIAVVVAVPAGIFAALRRGRAGDTGVMSAVLVGQSTPAFWTGILLVLVFAVQWQLLPASGYGSLEHLVLPAVTLAIYSVAVIARLLRSSLIEVLGSDHIRTARAKGLSTPAIIGSHALRHAALPVITVVGLEVGSLLGGAILTEQVFSWPGIGRLTVEAIGNRDFPLVQAAILFFAATFVVVNLVVDASYAILDPRVRVAHR